LNRKEENKDLTAEFAEGHGESGEKEIKRLKKLP
jgi:hypothetical protein